MAIHARVLPNSLRSFTSQIVSGEIALHRLCVGYADVEGENHIVSVTNLCDADLLLLVWWAASQDPRLIKHRKTGTSWCASPRNAGPTSCLCSIATLILQARRVIPDILLQELVMGERPINRLKVNGVTVNALFRKLAGLEDIETTLGHSKLKLESSDVQLLLQYPAELTELLHRLRLRRRRADRSSQTGSRKIHI